ncbi:ABC transporter substrate-binding protein [Paraburkholderia caballeronis]|uniref:NitT/TauT family transport system substrate-binding protein n=1 Tax=Paraburkholderia caballeronis TaxID=416943 RepID=A0A1H7G716_9BURK|nr:ABC transporter substrate-binding protein [Paraburkholderia caballeronis]PXW24743.1 NitT/TauT family transport system substrate-binding protein [Paraburkholderia caballeronis]PXX00473.1 NitT/TauT family transport system substrate-binding protein [Paraburkholderia caballeronis]RAJ98536.1 NitT/TauT family transport system substrate-binding protein [Paraburkholderia caballeronis]TDV16642.1 NitT/TauT family transport system substrate-binding protein [Paraburkholderia caballeronis]TDV19038.1 Nit
MKTNFPSASETPADAGHRATGPGFAVHAARRWLARAAGAAALAAGLFAAGVQAASAAPLRVGYSDWPGWVAWQVALDKGWFKEAGLDVQFDWFDYAASMDAFAANKLDAVLVTNGDALTMGANGAKNVMALITDYSNGNDMVVAKPPARTLKDLKGKKIGVEIGVVDHLLLLDGLQRAGMKESDVTLVNAKTTETPQVLGSSDIAAIAAWQPNAGEALRQVPGARPVFTSADEPGLIYDVLAVNPVSLASRKADWEKLAKVWYRVVHYINDPATQPDAVKIMAGRVGLTPEQYLPLLKGTRLLTLPEAQKAYIKAAGFRSLYGSSSTADAFNVKYAVYKTSQDVETYIDPSVTASLK